MCRAQPLPVETTKECVFKFGLKQGESRSECLRPYFNSWNMKQWRLQTTFIYVRDDRRDGYCSDLSETPSYFAIIVEIQCMGKGCFFFFWLISEDYKNQVKQQICRSLLLICGWLNEWLRGERGLKILYNIYQGRIVSSWQPGCTQRIIPACFLFISLPPA